MRRWWRFWKKPASVWLTPEAIQATMPPNSRSVIVHFGAEDHTDRFYWQLRRHDHIKDLAIRALRLTDRQLPLPLDAKAVQRFLEAVDVNSLVPLYLLQVPVSAIASGVLAQLSGNTVSVPAKVINLVMPAQVMYDFLSNGASDDAALPVSVGELLDGWPMKQSQTLAAFLQRSVQCVLGSSAPLPMEDEVQVKNWQQVDGSITELFDVPLRQAATTDQLATFMFTDIE